MNTQVNWKKLLLNLILWLAAEMILNLTELNDLSNYSEFVSQQNRLELWEAGIRFVNSSLGAVQLRSQKPERTIHEGNHY